MEALRQSTNLAKRTQNSLIQSQDRTPFKHSNTLKPNNRSRSEPGLASQLSIQDKLQEITGSGNLDNQVFKLNQTPNKKKVLAAQRGKNLDQNIVDNPPIKDHGGLLLTEFVIIGNARTAHDSRFMYQYQVSHILNTCKHSIPNIFDPMEMFNPETKQKLEQTQQQGSPLIGRVKYKNIEDWDEHRVNKLTDLNFLNGIFGFIEEAVQNFKSCLIVSVDNKCASVVLGVIYMMFKFKWNVHKTLEYICSMKTDIEITKTIIKQLQTLQGIVQDILKPRQVVLRGDWEIYSNLKKASRDENLAIRDLYRLASEYERMQNLQGLRKSYDAFFLGDTYQQAEDEASIINFFLNSKKIIRSKKKDTHDLSGSNVSMGEIIEQAKLQLHKNNLAKAKLLDWTALEKPDPKKTKRLNEEEQQRRLVIFFNEHHSKAKPEFNPNKKKLKKQKTVKQALQEMPEVGRMNSKRGVQTSINEAPVPKFSKKGTRYRHIDTQPDIEENERVKKKSSIKEGDAIMTRKMVGKEESGLSIATSVRNREGRFLNSSLVTEDSDPLKEGIPIKQMLAKQPSSVSPARPHKSQFAPMDQLKHKRTLKVKPSIAEIDFISNLPMVPTLKGMDSDLSKRRLERSLDNLTFHGKKTIISKDGSLKESSFDSLDEKGTEHQPKGGLLSARLQKKGEELKEQNRVQSPKKQAPLPPPHPPGKVLKLKASQVKMNSDQQAKAAPPAQNGQINKNKNPNKKLSASAVGPMVPTKKDTKPLAPVKQVSPPKANGVPPSHPLQPAQQLQPIQHTPGGQSEGDPRHGNSSKGPPAEMTKMLALKEQEFIQSRNEIIKKQIQDEIDNYKPSASAAQQKPENEETPSLSITRPKIKPGQLEPISLSNQKKQISKPIPEISMTEKKPPRTQNHSPEIKKAVNLEPHSQHVSPARRKIKPPESKESSATLSPNSLPELKQSSRSNNSRGLSDRPKPRHTASKGELIFLEADSPRPSNQTTTINSQQNLASSTNAGRMKTKNKYFVMMRTPELQTLNPNTGKVEPRKLSLNPTQFQSNHLLQPGSHHGELKLPSISDNPTKMSATFNNFPRPKNLSVMSGGGSQQQLMQPPAMNIHTKNSQSVSSLARQEIAKTQNLKNPNSARASGSFGKYQIHHAQQPDSAYEIGGKQGGGSALSARKPQLQVGFDQPEPRGHGSARRLHQGEDTTWGDHETYGPPQKVKQQYAQRILKNHGGSIQLQMEARPKKEYEARGFFEAREAQQNRGRQRGEGEELHHALDDLIKKIDHNKQGVMKRRQKQP